MFVFPITPKIRASDKNGFQIRILHRKIHRIKEKKHYFFYMTLNDNNSEKSSNILWSYNNCHAKSKTFRKCLPFFRAPNVS